MQFGRHPQNPPQLCKYPLTRQGLNTQRAPFSYFNTFPEPIRKRSDGLLTNMKQVQGSTGDMYCKDLKGNYSDIPELLKWKQTVSSVPLLPAEATGHLFSFHLIDKKWENKNYPKSKIQDNHLKCVMVHIERKVGLKCHGFTVYGPFCSCACTLHCSHTQTTTMQKASPSFPPSHIQAHLSTIKPLIGRMEVPHRYETFNIISISFFP